MVSTLTTKPHFTTFDLISIFAMDQLTMNKEMFGHPKYVVNSFLFGTNDDKSRLEVRRYDKCFYISLDLENLQDSPQLCYMFKR